MTEDPDIKAIDAESQALATAFALGELDDAGLERLHSLLQGDTPTARLTARNTWQTLAMRTDLRSALAADSFSDVVRLKIDEGREGGGFLRSLWRRMGWSPRQLEPVRPLPSPSGPVRQWPRRLGLLGLALMAILVTILIRWQSPTTTARVNDILGHCRIDGQTITRDAMLPSGVLSVPPHGRLDLTLDDGARIRLHGPAQATIAPHSLALASGRAGIATTTQSLNIGGPDGHVRVLPDCHMVIEIIDARLALGTITGQAVLRDRNGAEHVVTSGQAGYDQRLFAWQQTAVPSSGSWPLPDEHHPALWQISGIWQPLSDGALSLLDHDDATILHITGTGVNIDGQILALSGAPRQARQLRLRGDDNGLVLTIDGLARPLSINSRQPSTLRISGSGHLEAGRWWSGPDHSLAHE